MAVVNCTSTVADEFLGAVLERERAFVAEAYVRAVLHLDVAVEAVALARARHGDRPFGAGVFGTHGGFAREEVVGHVGGVGAERAALVSARRGQTVGAVVQHGLVVVGRDRAPEVEPDHPAVARRRVVFVDVDGAQRDVVVADAVVVGLTVVAGVVELEPVDPLGRCRWLGSCWPAPCRHGR